MDWLIRALSAVREVRDLSSPKNGGRQSKGSREKREAPRSRDLVAKPIGPAKAPAPAPAKVPAPAKASVAPPPPPPPKAPPAPPPPPPRIPDHERARQARIARQAAKEKDEGKQQLPLRLIDRDALEVVRRLRRFGHTAYLVGGCVRDLWLGLEPKDFDVATSARPEEIRAVFRNCRIIGRRFRLAHVYFRGGKVIETSTFRAMVEAQENDEGEEPPDLLIRHDNVFGSEEEDARRRDFTVNGLFYDVASGRIIDHVGGLEDLAAKKVRMIGDPDIRLREDPVRTLRAARIAAKIGFDIDPALKVAMKSHKSEIERCSKSRVLEETLKLLRGGFASPGIRWLDEAEVLDALMPEVFEHLIRARSADPPNNLFWAHLDALDARARKMNVDDAVILAALLYPLIDEVQGNGAAVERFHLAMDLVDRVGARMAVTRKLSERLRQVVTAQRHFERSPSGKRTRRRVNPATLARRSFFQDAIDLFEIRSIARGESLEGLDEWRGAATRPETEEPAPAPESDAPDADTAPDEEGAPKRRRRRRRRSAP